MGLHQPPLFTPTLMPLAPSSASLVGTLPSNSEPPVLLWGTPWASSPGTSQLEPSAMEAVWPSSGPGLTPSWPKWSAAGAPGPWLNTCKPPASAPPPTRSKCSVPAPTPFQHTRNSPRMFSLWCVPTFPRSYNSSVHFISSPKAVPASAGLAFFPPTQVSLAESPLPSSLLDFHCATSWPWCTLNWGGSNY